MSKHIIDSARVRSGSAKLTQFLRIDRNGRPTLQSKALQKRVNNDDTTRLTRRFLDIDRRKNLSAGKIL